MTKYLDEHGLRIYEATVKDKLDNKQDTLVSGTNIKTINNESLLGSGNINISSGGTATDVRINGTSITSNDVADIQTQGTYNSSTNKIATMDDIPTDYVTTDTIQDITGAKTFKNVLNIQNGQGTGSMWIGGDVNASTLTNNSRHLARISVPSYSNVSLASTLLGFDSSGDSDMHVTNKGSDAVSFGGMKKITNATSPMAIGFCVATERNGTTANQKVYPLEMDSSEARFNVQPNYNGANLATVNDIPTVPTKVSDLQNDAGYITGYTETDPIFSASAAAGITSSDITSWNNKSTFSGNYNDLTNKPTIPDSTSDLTNDSGFIDNTVSNLTNYTTTTALTTLLDGKMDWTELSSSTVRIWDLEPGAYKTTTAATLYYNGASGSGSERIGNGALIFVSKSGTTTKAFYVLASYRDTTTQVLYFNNYVGYTSSTEGYCYEAINTGDVINNLTSTSSTSPLSAAQGKALKDLIDGLATVASTGDYDDLINKPTIPTVPTTVSSFTNDAGYITSSALSGYATTSDLDDVQDQVDANTANIINLTPTVLYNNTSGSKTSITLSDSVSNYSYLEIFYGWETNSFGTSSTRYDMAMNGNINLSTSVLNNSYIYFGSSEWTPTGNKINLAKGEYWRGRVATQSAFTRTESNNISIYKVLGYK